MMEHIVRSVSVRLMHGATNANRRARNKTKKKICDYDYSDWNQAVMSVEDKAKAAKLAELVLKTNNPSVMRTIEVKRHGRIFVTEHVYNLIEKDKQEACVQRTPEWFRKRQNHVTASMMATICGANPYETRSAALKKKTGAERPFSGNAATDHGNKYEFEAILKYEKATGQKCIEFGLLESLNEDEGFLAGSPDGITSTGRLIEVKCPLMRTPTKEIPNHYKYQIQFLMHTLRLESCDFIQYVPEGVWTTEKFIVTHVKYDPYFWVANFPKIVSFWNQVCDIREERDNNIIKEENVDDDEDNEDTANGIGFTPKNIVIVLDEDETVTCKKKRARKGEYDRSKCIISEISDDTASPVVEPLSLPISPGKTVCNTLAEALEQLDTDVQSGRRVLSPSIGRSDSGEVANKTKCLIKL